MCCVLVCLVCLCNPVSLVCVTRKRTQGPSPGDEPEAADVPETVKVQHTYIHTYTRQHTHTHTQTDTHTSHMKQLPSQLYEQEHTLHNTYSVTRNAHTTHNTHMQHTRTTHKQHTTPTTHAGQRFGVPPWSLGTKHKQNQR